MNNALRANDLPFINFENDQDREILWQSRIDRTGMFLQLQDDGRLVIKKMASLWEADADDADVVEEDDEMGGLSLSCHQVYARACVPV